MAREKTVKIDVRLSERDANRLNEVMKFGEWNRSEAIRFLLNFGYFIMTMMPSILIETVLDSMEPTVDEEE